MAKPTQYLRINSRNVSPGSRIQPNKRPAIIDPLPLRRRLGARRAGLTLIEMMVSIALTLIVILAVIRLFDIVGGTVSESRTILELSAQLRNVSQQLQRDLDRATVTMLPPVDPDSGSGFFELIEGPDSDWDPQYGILFDEEANLGRNVRDPATPDQANINGSLIPNPLLRGRSLDMSGRYGDLDDVLMFTIRSDGEPFVGRIGEWAWNMVGNTNVIRSEYALVVWWVEKHYAGGQAGLFPPPAQSLKLHRRQFLIRPDLNQLLLGPLGVNGVLDAIKTTDYHQPSNQRTATQNTLLNTFLDKNDLAVFPNPAGTGLQASSLSDLADRRKRYGHSNFITNALTYPGRTFLHPGDNDVARIKAGERTTPPDTGLISASAPYSLRTVYPLGLLSRDTSYRPLLPQEERDFYGRAGEDVVIGDILAFDVKVYDPNAPLIPSPDGSVVLAPHDPGYWTTLRNSPPAIIAMRGAFVDLGYARHVLPTPFFQGSHFFGFPTGKSGLGPTALANHAPEYDLYRSDACVTYDTWSTGYERDGQPQFSSGIDLGINGLDDNNNGIVDDITEKDTLPPYPHPLRGIEVTIRVAEPGGAQQVRQTSVVANFKHE